MKLTPIAVAFLAAILPASAQGLEARGFADAFAGLLGQAGINVSFDTARLDGQDIILEGMRSEPGDGDPRVLDLTIMFKNVAETDDGGYSADRATIDRFVFGEGEFSVRLDGLVWENVLFHELPPSDGAANLFHQSRLFTGPLRVFNGDDEVFSIGYFESGNVADEANEIINYSTIARQIRLDLSKLPDQENAPPEIEDFGLTVLDMELGAQAEWNVAEGQLQVSNSFIDIGDVGRLAFSADLLGYDREVLTDLLSMQREAYADGATTEEESMAQAKRLTNALFLNGASMRFDDDGITNKVLDFTAKEQGIPRAAMTIGFAAALPIMASEMGVSESLQTALLSAATDFMINPRSFDLNLEPNKPVRLSRLAAAIEDEDAGALLGMFNFSVAANQD